MKVLHVTKKYPEALGGDAAVVSNLEKQQKANGHKVIILTSNCPDIRARRNVYKSGFKGQSAALDKITPKRLASLILLFFATFKVLKAERPDIIHTHSVDMAFVISFAARRYNIPIVHSFHIVTSNDPDQSFLRRKSELFLLRFTKPEKVLVLNPANVNELERAGFNNIMFVPNGVTIEDWPAKNHKKKNSFTFITVARLENDKGLKYLIDAVAMLRDTNVNFSVQIVGDGSLKAELLQQIHDLELKKYVSLLGRRNHKQLGELYANADVFVLPSLIEAMPITLLEAWAVGLPTVVTKVNGIPLLAGKASKIIEPKNALQLKLAMADLIKNNGHAEALAKEGHDLVRTKYQWATVSKKINIIYQDLLTPRIIHLADFVPPYLEGGGGSAISTTKNIEFLSKNSQYYVLTRRHQDKPWIYANSKVYPALPRIIIAPSSIGQMVRYVITNSSASVYRRSIKKYSKMLKPDMLYITSNCLPLMRAAIKTGIPTFIDVRDDYFNDPIMSRRVPKEKNQFIYLYRHITERNLIPSGLKPFSVPIVAIFLLHAKFQRLLLRVAILKHTNAYFIALSNYINLKLREFGIPAYRIVTIYNSADIDSPEIIYEPSERNNTVVFAGIIEKTKGVWTIMSAAEKLKKLQIEFVIVGDGPDLDKLRSYVKEHELNNVQILGKLSHKDVIKLYSKARIIVAPSIWPEPFGRFIQESIVTQTPLITTNVGGIPEGIINRKTGLLIDPNDVNELANSIKLLFKDDKIYVNIFNNLLKSKSKYSSEKIGAKRLEYMQSFSNKAALNQEIDRTAVL